MAAGRSLVIVITGASRGLGAGMAEVYLKQGHKLGLCARSSKPSASFYSESSFDDHLLYQSVDVCDEHAVGSFLDAVVEKFGPIDMWINNAGILDPIQPIRNMSYEDFDRNMQINLGGVFKGTKAYINHVRSQPQSTPLKDATLVNISSGAAQKGYAGWGAYSSGKGAVDRLTESAFLEETEDSSSSNTNFRAYAIAPGVIDTDMQVMIRSSSKEDFPMLDKFISIKEKDSFNSIPFVAKNILELALKEGPQTLPVVQRFPNEK
ncbi:unnamed protein product [Cylindrotheca closterium]|uniref:Uncharacterized protein n=1 Tax=Cylindrotheca closterium TaxID=2856 RepID=A0AAD2CPM8_9STRA|nr:unnamed protein product [Cylindrotheca closterium]